MEVKPGYKQTEAGVIPEEWECAKLLNFLSFISYGFTNPMPTVQDGVFMVTAADINDGRIHQVGPGEQIDPPKLTDPSGHGRFTIAAAAKL